MDRCICGARKLRDQRRCFSCESWNRRQQQGSAPEFGQRSRPQTERDMTAGSSMKHTALAEAVALHPSAQIAEVTYPCFAHGTADALECEGCRRNGEMDWEQREDI